MHITVVQDNILVSLLRITWNDHWGTWDLLGKPTQPNKNLKSTCTCYHVTMFYAVTQDIYLTLNPLNVIKQLYFRNKT